MRSSIVIEPSEQERVQNNDRKLTRKNSDSIPPHEALLRRNKRSFAANQVGTSTRYRTKPPPPHFASSSMSGHTMNKEQQRLSRWCQALSILMLVLVAFSRQYSDSSVQRKLSCCLLVHGDDDWIRPFLIGNSLSTVGNLLGMFREEDTQATATVECAIHG